ncbi:lasso peptide biosynthesis B2 protein [Frankia sp. Cpl3]|uniref:lasso peptide biosynthesis B2 protein n=1 Tax=Parafrankia colletiae TaxID=573497 RepID=UPI000B1C286A|nr:lasso peptide biosynthesis B2 protein [Parafrankia colletiae]MCK9898707.1 lasso peptide biosynthesis B2 protein [Frankia sp. Cpl3]
MTGPGRLTGPGRRRATRAVVALPVTVVARGLVRLPPARLRQVLDAAAAGTRPAGYQQTLAAMEAVTAVSRTCRDPSGCLPRAVATALLCRVLGRWPTWRTGVRTAGSFAAHAWVEADGLAVGESFPPDAYQPVITVRSRPRQRDGERDAVGSR